MANITKAQEKFVKQCSRVNSRNVELDKIDVEDPEIQPIEKEPGIEGTASPLVHFKALYSKELDLTETTDEDKRTQGRFVDPKTEVTWRAFKAALRQQVLGIQRSQGHLKRKIFGERNKDDECFIIGMEVNDGTVQFSRRPVIRPSQRDAVQEAERLSDQYKHNFSVFKRVDKIGPFEPTAPVEETKQKEAGKPIKHPSFVMEELKEFITNKSLEKVPSGIILTLDGKYRVETNSFGTYYDCETYAEALSFIIDWIKQNKKELKVQNVY